MYRDKTKLRAATAKHAKWRRAAFDALKNGPCQDCGGSFPPCAMDFDHRDPTTKTDNVAQMFRNSMVRVMAEIEKCDLVCANCHRIRTFSRNREEAA